ncbi:MAG: CsgG/HfaB family protein [Planctomycetaceae bacterium]
MFHPTFCYGATASLVIVLLSTSVVPAQAKRKDDAAIYPIAILPFQERGRDAAELGGKVNDLLFAELIAKPNIYLVEREDVKKLFEEQELNLSGLVNPGQATQVGYLTGAKIIVTGSVILVDADLHLVAKVIGTETSRVLGASSKGKIDDDLADLVKELADSVSETIATRATDLVARPVTRDDRLAAISKSLGDGKRPSVWIDIPERHVGQTMLDPAAATELALYCKEAGFEVIDDKEGSRNDADVLLIGEGLSQFAARHGNLVSVKARLELKALDQETGRVLAIDRQVAVSVDLAEQLAGKEALQEAAANIAERMLPKIVKSSKKK